MPNRGCGCRALKKQGEIYRSARDSSVGGRRELCEQPRYEPVEKIGLVHDVSTARHGRDCEQVGNRSHGDSFNT